MGLESILSIKGKSMKSVRTFLVHDLYKIDYHLQPPAEDNPKLLKAQEPSSLPLNSHNFICERQMDPDMGSGETSCLLLATCVGELDRLCVPWCSHPQHRASSRDLLAVLRKTNTLLHVGCSEQRMEN